MGIGTDTGMDTEVDMGTDVGICIVVGMDIDINMGTDEDTGTDVGMGTDVRRGTDRSWVTLFFLLRQSILLFECTYAYLSIFFLVDLWVASSFETLEVRQ